MKIYTYLHKIYECDTAAKMNLPSSQLSKLKKLILVPPQKALPLMLPPRMLILMQPSKLPSMTIA